ncbi:MAG TPA: hypothetical protein PKE47_12420, partial [Verrucomicrobiota bacterium]|nr:hypothetical protein [Verrucomicrobiota bacterium]
QRAGDGLASRIARWDGTTWSPLGSGLGTLNTTIVRALAVLPDGDLVAAGRFTTAGGKAAANIARWNGSEWFPLGAGLGSGVFDVSALLVTPAGELIAGGNFTSSGSSPVPGVARWNGEAWLPYGAGVTGNLYALGLLPDGALIAAGDGIRAADDLTQRNVLRWDGTRWLGLSAAVPAGPVTWALAVLSDGTLVSGQSSVNIWNGVAWQPLGGGTAGFVHSFTRLPDGGLVMGGEFLGVGLLDDALRRHAAHLARWDGAAWQTYGTGFGGRQRTYVYDFVTLPGGDVIAGGAFDAAGDVEAGNVGRGEGAAGAAPPPTG